MALIVQRLFQRKQAGLGGSQAALLETEAGPDQKQEVDRDRSFPGGRLQWLAQGSGAERGEPCMQPASAREAKERSASVPVPVDAGGSSPERDE